MVLAVDLGLAFVALLSFLSGWRNGFLETLFSIGAWVGGVLIAFHTTAPLREVLPEWATSVPGIEIVLGVVIFLVAFVVIRLIGHAAGTGSHQADSQGDRALGGLLGLARGLLALSKAKQGKFDEAADALVRMPEDDPARDGYDLLIRRWRKE